MTQFEKEFYTSNRERLQNSLAKNQVAIITAHRQIELSRDAELPFSQERNFHYLTGDTRSQQMILLVDAQKTTLAGVQPSDLDRQWNGVPSLSQVAEEAGIEDVIELARLDDGKLVATLSGKKVLLVASRIATTSAVVANPAHSELRQALTDVKWSDAGELNQILADLRAIKKPCEVQLINDLASTTIDIINELEDELFEFTSERSVSDEIEYRIRKAGFDGYGFTPIVAAGANAATLHHRSSASPVLSDSVLLLDIGAGGGFYSADISRTVNGPDGGKRQQDIIERVKEVQAALIQSVEPGITFQELEQRPTT